MGLTKEDKLFDPRYCLYKLNEDTTKSLDKLIDSDSIDKETKTILDDFRTHYNSSNHTTDYHSLADLHKYMQRADPDYTDPFYVLMESCEYIEQNKRDNKQLDKRLKHLSLKMSQRIYDRMTASVDRQVEDKLVKEEDSSIDTANQGGQSEFRKVHGSVVAVFNSFLVYLCTFTFFYKAVEYALPTPNIVAQVTSGLVASTVVGLAELYFLLRIV